MIEFNCFKFCSLCEEGTEDLRNRKPVKKQEKTDDIFQKSISKTNESNLNLRNSNIKRIDGKKNVKDEDGSDDKNVE